MKLETLLALGAEVVCGGVALHQYSVGRLMADGTVLLTPDGEQHIAEIQAGIAAMKTPAKGGKGLKVKGDDPVKTADDAPPEKNPLEGAGE